jgi:hypothetical protein
MATINVKQYKARQYNVKQYKVRQYNVKQYKVRQYNVRQHKGVLLVVINIATVSI